MTEHRRRATDAPPTYRRRWQVPREWQQRFMTLAGALVLLAAAYMLVDYVSFSACQTEVNEQSAAAARIRSDAFEASVDAQIRVTVSLLRPGTDRNESRAALEGYLQALEGQKNVRAQNPLPELRRCR